MSFREFLYVLGLFTALTMGILTGYPVGKRVQAGRDAISHVKAKAYKAGWNACMEQF